MNELVLVKSNDAVTTSLIIAEGTGLQLKSITRTIRAKQKRLERFGILRFSDLKSTNPKGGRPSKVYYLNEMQATLLMTYLNNSEVVDDFKEELVRQFYDMKGRLREKATQTWLDARRYGVLARKEETSILQKLVEYAKQQKSKHAEMLYMTYSKLANGIVGLKGKGRELANTMQLTQLLVIENIIMNVVRQGMAEGKYYKDIYKDCKARLEQYLEVSMINTNPLLLGGIT